MVTPFHRVARETPEHAWWKLPVAGLVAIVFYIGASVVLIIGVFAAVFASGHDVDTLDAWFESTTVDLASPGFFALDMLTIAVMLPAVLLAVLVIGPRPIGYLTSVEGRRRWRWLARSSAIAFAVFGPGIGGLVALSFWIDPDSVHEPSGIGWRVILTLALVLTLTPFQAAAEEYVFRGYVLQLVGSWTKRAWISVVVSIPLFVSGHAYNSWGLVDVGLFGLMAAYLAIRTGGLEASIAAHTANNVSIMVFEALGILDTSEGGGPLDLIPTAIMNALFAWLAVRASDRHGIVRTRAPIPPPPPPVWPQQPAYGPAYVWQPPAWPPPPPPPPELEWVPPTNTPPYPGYLPPGWRP